MSHLSRLFMLLSLVTFTASISPSVLIAFDEPMLSIGKGNTTGVNAVDKRKRIPFRYYGSGSPF